MSTQRTILVFFLIHSLGLQQSCEAVGNENSAHALSKSEQERADKPPHHFCAPKKFIGAGIACVAVLISFLVYKNRCYAYQLSQLKKKTPESRIKVETPHASVEIENQNVIVLKNKHDEFIFIHNWITKHPRIWRVMRNDHHVWMHFLDGVIEARKEKTLH